MLAPGALTRTWEPAPGRGGPQCAFRCGSGISATEAKEMRGEPDQMYVNGSRAPAPDTPATFLPGMPASTRIELGSGPGETQLARLEPGRSPLGDRPGTSVVP
ncbi:MAG: hypothetical protein ACRYG2_23870 [Janthinobacterium lividum]